MSYPCRSNKSFIAYLFFSYSAGGFLPLTMDKECKLWERKLLKNVV